jgi:DNA-binding transcriptional MerR regulator
MTDPSAQVEIPNRALFKAAEVCDLLQVQPYVLRSWEAEFPGLGISKTAGAPRVYRRADVEQVMRIKHMLLVDGLTLAGARRKLEEDTSPVGADEPAINELVGRNARERLTARPPVDSRAARWGRRGGERAPRRCTGKKGAGLVQPEQAFPWQDTCPVKEQPQQGDASQGSLNSPDLF